MNGGTFKFWRASLGRVQAARPKAQPRTSRRAIHPLVLAVFVMPLLMGGRARSVPDRAGNGVF